MLSDNAQRGKSLDPWLTAVFAMIGPKSSLGLIANANETLKKVKMQLIFIWA